MSRTRLARFRDTPKRLSISYPRAILNYPRPYAQKSRRFERTKVLITSSWLSPLKFDTRHGQLVGGAIAAGQWLFESPQFTEWVSGERRALRCHRAPGAGKTVLSPLIIERLQSTLETEVPVIFLYLTHKEGQEQTVANLLGSLLKQLIQSKERIPEKVVELYNESKKKEVRPTAEKIFDLLKQELKLFPKVYIIVDALDESEEDIRKSFIDYLLRADADRTSFLLTARSLGDMIGFRSIYCNLCGSFAERATLAILHNVKTASTTANSVRTPSINLLPSTRVPKFRLLQKMAKFRNISTSESKSRTGFSRFA